MYILCESGRIWQLVIDGWLKSQDLEEVPGLPQIFIRLVDGIIVLALCKVVDDILIVGSAEHIHEFYTALSEKFTVGRMHMDQTVIFNGLRIARESNVDVVYDMEEYFNSITTIDITRDRRKQSNSPCTDQENRRFFSLTGSLNWLGHGVLPQASFAASHLQQMMGNLTNSFLITANKVLLELNSLQSKATIKHPSSLADPSHPALSDAIQGK